MGAATPAEVVVMREALYLVKFGDVENGQRLNGGVAVLETNRIFGGDSGYFYLGTYTLKDGEITATVEVTKHDPEWRNAFGDDARVFKLQITGQVDGQDIVGTMRRLDTGQTLPIALLYTARLPG
jgi:hypothetical protein